MLKELTQCGVCVIIVVMMILPPCVTGDPSDALYGWMRNLMPAGMAKTDCFEVANMENSYRFFQNKACQYFPCHKVKDDRDFNCLFCYCPLYALGDRCGGNWTYTEDDVKDCSACLIPHSPGGYDYIHDKFSQIAQLAKTNRKESGK